MSSKIHKCTVIQADLHYVGSITIDEDLLDACGMWGGEKVLVVSNTSGSRLETYTIVGPRGSGMISVNGAAAHHIKEGEEIIIVGFSLVDDIKGFSPSVIHVTDKENKKYERLSEAAGMVAP